jgi:mRNA-degrading endonuclease RelE of RelBE toxin-antitoxin system
MKVRSPYKGKVMLYDLDIRPSAQRDFARLSPDVARRIARKLESL